MANNIIDDPKAFFRALGDMHDADIMSFSWDRTNRALKISVEDLNIGYLDLPGYEGLQPADIIFSEVTSLDISLQIFDDIFNIFDMEIENNGSGYIIEIPCSPGYFKCQCNTVKLIEK